MNSARLSSITYDQLLDKIMLQIDSYSVGLVGVVKKKSGKKYSLLGSGTLAQVDKLQGVLTAQHVVGSRGLSLKKYDYIGFAYLPHPHEPIAPWENFHFIDVAEPKSDSEGPDLSFIIPPPEVLSWLRAKKQFWNIGSFRNQVLPCPLNKDLGLWRICGFADEFTESTGPKRNLDDVTSFCYLMSPVYVESEYFKDDYDYLDVAVRYHDNSILPKSFGGFSGGGLWQIPVFPFQNDILVKDSPIFSGVMFYETEIKDNKRLIRCHGRQSIYEKVYNVLKQPLQ